MFRKANLSRVIVTATAFSFLLASSNSFAGSAHASTNVQAKNTQKSGTRAATKSPYRLSESIIPSRYDLLFTPDAERGKFSGKATIDLDLKASQDAIVMNSVDLKIKSAKISKLSDKSSTPLQVKYEAGLERVSFLSPKKLPAGKYQLSCDFDGVLNDKLVGFYRSSYKDKQNKTHYLATTQMEPTDARRMFPCFDEPAMKSTFKLSALIDKNLVAISNGAMEKESDVAAGKKLVTFAETPKMSSYLLALCVGEFKSTEPSEVEGVTVRVWSVERDPALGNYARDAAGKVLKFQNAYFQIPYPWGKLDLIAIPDFQAGAMENPGAITFREALLVLDEKSASLDAKQDCVSVIAHEMAHQWFGDLVTMKWWDDIWLNEAFATWMASKTVNNVVPEWNVMSQFFSSRQNVMKTDALRSTRPIQSAVVKPSDALQMFDDITYVKGAAILRMLEVFLSEKTFQAGVSSYLKKHSFANASTNDLWVALQSASGKPVSAIMQSWCKQPGYPLVTVSKSGKGSDTKYSFSQERFLLDGQKSPGQKWMVPLALRSPKEPVQPDSNGHESVKPDSLQLCQQASCKLDLSPSDKFFFANAGGFGFYRTKYPSDVHKQIQNNLNLLSAGERLAFLGDQYSLAIAGNIPVESYLDSLNLFREEQDLGVWETMLREIGFLDLFVDKSSKPAFASFVRNLLKNEYERLGWEEKAGESSSARIIRGSIIGMMGTIGEDKEAITRARKMFGEYLKNPDSVPADLIGPVTSIVSYNGSRKEFNEMKALFKKPATPEIEQRNLFALSNFREPALIEELHKMILSKEVRTQDSQHLLGALFANTETKLNTWNFLKSHYGDLKKLYSQQVLGRLAAYPGSFITQGIYNDVQAFFASHPVPEGETDKNRMLEKMRIAVKFNVRSGKALNQWLKTRGSKI